MNPIVIGALALICTFGGALLGMALRRVLPPQHVDAESSGTVKLGIGLIATMTALVLGLITSSAKSSFDAVNVSLRDAAADVLALDRALARFGPDGDETRALLHTLVANRVDAIWPPDGGVARVDLPDVHGAEDIASQIQRLTPQTAEQRWLQGRAAALTESLLEARWMIAAGGTNVLAPFLAALLFWLSITFISFGLFAPRNFTVVSTLFVCSLSVAGAVFLVLEMDGPFDGVVRVSPEPLRYVLEQMSR